jgi:murein peptide amidase A
VRIFRFRPPEKNVHHDGVAQQIDVIDYLREFGEIAAQQGFAAAELCQTSAGPILAWERLGAGKTIYLSAGMHGDEPAGPLAMLELLRAGFFRENATWRLCPVINPTGLAAGTRENANGLDLNRDYLICESLEIRSHKSWLAGRSAPDLFISLHEDWETSGFYYYEINQRCEEPQSPSLLMAAVSPWFAPEPLEEIDGHMVNQPGWIFHCSEPDLREQWPEAIFLAKHGCPVSYTLETPSQASLDARVSAQMAAVRVLTAFPA